MTEKLTYEELELRVKELEAELAKLKAKNLESQKEPKPESEVAGEVKGSPLVAPMPGLIVSYEKQVGDTVSEGETVVILEAMKMENALPAPVSGTIKSINFSNGDTVAINDILCVIG
jgi:oxaloacetate decarboxylase alpha subunit/pyruvate carboxylase subunit B